MIGTKKMASMMAQIANGVSKSDSHHVTDAETSAAWDKLAAEHADLRAKYPDARIEIPSDPDVF